MPPCTIMRTCTARQRERRRRLHILKGSFNPRVGASHVCRSPDSSVSVEAPWRAALLSDTRDRPRVLQIRNSARWGVTTCRSSVENEYLNLWNAFMSLSEDTLPITTRLPHQFNFIYCFGVWLICVEKVNRCTFKLFLFPYAWTNNWLIVKMDNNFIHEELFTIESHSDCFFANLQNYFYGYLLFIAQSCLLNPPPLLPPIHNVIS